MSQKPAPSSRLERFSKLMGDRGDLTLQSTAPKTTFVNEWFNRQDSATAAGASDDMMKHSITNGSTVTSIDYSEQMQSLDINSTSDPDDNHSFSLDDRVGQTSPVGMRFVPITALAKFPFKFLPDLPNAVKKDIFGRFFDVAKFHTRRWELYYIHSSLIEAEKPLILVSEAEARSLIDEIAVSFGDHEIAFPKPSFEGFLVEFQGPQEELRPVRLGLSTSRDHFTFLKDNAPYVELQDQGSLDTEQVKAFKGLVQLATDAHKAKKQAAAKDLVRQQGFRQQLDLAMGYLGLAGRARGLPVTELDVKLPPPFDFAQDTVIIACDVESFERNHNLITEIGLATIDTRDLETLSPGTRGESWRSKIRARHFRISEYIHLENHDFVMGCADAFRFGESEMISIHSAPRAVANCFKHPFSKPGTTSVDHLFDYNDPPAPDIDASAERRNIVFVGHGTQGDIKYLQTIGYNVHNLSNLVGVLDTASLWQSHAKVRDPPSLSKICYGLGIEPWSMHNAGNDAVYTLQSLLGICVDAAVAAGSGVPAGVDEGGVSLGTGGRDR